MEDATYHSRSNDGKETSFTGSDSHLEHDFEESLDGLDQSPVKYIRLRTLAMGLIVSLGGLIFGYDIGQISGFVQMPDFIARFAGPSGSFSNWKEGLIVGLVNDFRYPHSKSSIDNTLIPVIDWHIVRCRHCWRIR